MPKIFLKSIEFLEDVTPLKKDFKIEFTNSITVLVGDNGVGKSTITDALGDFLGKNDDTYMKRKVKASIKVEKEEETFPYKCIDFHGDDKKFAGAFGDNISLQMMQMKASSGQVTISLLSNAKFKDFHDGLLILDEPERGLSIRNQNSIGTLLVQLSILKNVQIIMTCHSDIILKTLSKFGAKFYEVKLEKYLTYEEYIESQK